MGTFSKKSTSRREVTGTTHHGHATYETSPELDLYSAAITMLDGKDSFYEKSGLQDRLNGNRVGKTGRMLDLIDKVSPEFVAKLAVYLTEQANLRTTPVMLAVELAIDKRQKESGLVRKIVNRIVRRPDQIVEMLSYFAELNKANWKSNSGNTAKFHKMPHSLQRGLKDAFTKFDEYQLSKYNRSTEIKLKDALFLLHPKPLNEEQEALWKRLIDGSLATADTWETRKSQAGQTKEVSSKETWENLVSDKKMGYMATLRNLRNMLDDNVSKETIDTALSYLTNPKAVANSKQFPYRFLSAYKELSSVRSMYVGQVLEALETAVLHSVGNMELFQPEDRVMVASDVSGSMDRLVSSNSVVTRKDIGLLMGMLAYSHCKQGYISVFGESFKTLSYNRKTPLANCIKDRGNNFGVGHSTNGHKVIQYLLRENIELDKIVIITDEQFWAYSYGRGDINAEWAAYRSKYPHAKLFLIDVNGYGRTPVSTDYKTNTYKLAGWSESSFSMMVKLSDGGSIIDEIMSIEL